MPSPAPRDRLRLAPVVVVLASLIVFAPSLAGRFVWDDHVLLEFNPSLARASLLSVLGRGLWGFASEAELGFKDRYYRPVVSFAYAAQYKLAGPQPIVYHTTNVLLHAACVALAFGWLRRRLGGTPSAAAGATLGAALFALHPTRVENVAWISGCTDLWMALFLLGALHVWDVVAGRARAPATLALLALAFLSKEAAVVVPALLALDLWLLGRSERAAWRAWAALTAGFVALVVWRSFVLPLGPTGVRWSATEHLSAVLSSIGHYARLVVWPHPFTFFVGRRVSDAQGEHFAPWSVALGALVLASTLALAAAAKKRPSLRPALADLAWLLVGLAPVVNLRPLGLPMLVSGRFLYLPLLGVAALVARAVAAAWEDNGRRRVIATAAVGALALVAGAASTRDIEHVLDDVALFSHERSLDPANLQATGELGRAWMREGRRGRALAVLLDGARSASQRPFVDVSELTNVNLTAALAIVQGTPDADQETLARLRAFYDDLDAAAPGQSVRVVTRYGALTLRKWAPAGEPVRALYLVHLPAAEVHARTLDPDGAARALAPALREASNVDVVLQTQAMVLAGQSRWNDLLRVSELGLRNGSASFWTAFRAQLEALARVPEGSVERGRIQAEILLMVRLVEGARRVLDAELARHPEALRLVELRIRAELYDRQWASARTWLEGAERTFPEGAPAWAVQRRYLATHQGAPDPMAP
jgi:hypothetical protein